jgi:cation:H+ antiporter
MDYLGLADWPLWAVVGLFLAAAVVIAIFGARLASVSDRLADLTGLGEAIFGAVLLGGGTSLPGIVTSVVTAWEGYPELSIANAAGGIAAQTTFLAIADMTYRKVNLEHAAASVGNLLQAALLCTLLSIPIIAASGPNLSWFGIHPVSVLLVLGYLGGLRMISNAQKEPSWTAEPTPETRSDEPDEESGDLSGMQVARVWLRFVLLAAITAGAGFVVAQTGVDISERSGLSETVVGALFTAIATSLPELVTSIAAVRQGALTLAVGGVIGGNCFDTLFVAFADFAYRDGSIYHAMTERQVYVLGLSVLLAGILMAGLLRREKRGIGNIGFESFLVLLIYVVGVGLLFFE